MTIFILRWQFSSDTGTVQHTKPEFFTILLSNEEVSRPLLQAKWSVKNTALKNLSVRKGLKGYPCLWQCDFSDQFPQHHLGSLLRIQILGILCLGTKSRN